MPLCPVAPRGLISIAGKCVYNAGDFFGTHVRYGYM